MISLLIFLLNILVILAVLALFAWIFMLILGWMGVTIPLRVRQIIGVILLLMVAIYMLEALSSAGNGLLFNPHWR
jgi:hypothetical protein